MVDVRSTPVLDPTEFLSLDLFLSGMWSDDAFCPFPLEVISSKSCMPVKHSFSKY